DGLGAWPRRLSPDVDDVDPSRLHRQRAVHGTLHVVESTTVREAVGRDVENPHDERASSEVERASGEAERIGRTQGKKNGRTEDRKKGRRKTARAEDIPFFRSSVLAWILFLGQRLADGHRRHDRPGAPLVAGGRLGGGRGC